MDLAAIDRGDSALIVDVPHAGVHVPDDIARRLAPAARALPDTDWHVGDLYAFARASGAPVSATLKAEAKAAIERIPASSPGLRVSEALYLLVTSPEYAVQR